jgi:hypothetical protein
MKITKTRELLSVFEAMFGQFYIAVIISRMVGMKKSSSGKG